MNKKQKIMNEEVKRSTTQLLKAPFGGLGASSIAVGFSPIAVGFSQRTGDANFSGLQPHILKMWLKPVSLLSFIQWIINKFENLFSVTPAFMPELRPSRANRGFSPQPEHFGLKPGFTFGISIPGLKPGVSDVNTACDKNSPSDTVVRAGMHNCVIQADSRKNLFSVTPAFMPELRLSRANRGFSPQPEHFGLKPGFIFGVSIPGLKPGVSDVNTACKTNRKEFQQFSIYNALSSAPFRGLGVEHLIRLTGNKGFLLISYLTISLTIERLKMIKNKKSPYQLLPNFGRLGEAKTKKMKNTW